MCVTYKCAIDKKGLFNRLIIQKSIKSFTSQLSHYQFQKAQSEFKHPVIQQDFYVLHRIQFNIFFPDGWAKDDLIYQWKKKDPVQVVPGLHLPRFTLEQYKSAYCDVITNTGKSRQ